MKKILVSIIVLLTAIATMAYLYFSKLNADHKTSDIGLQAAAANAALIFTFENEKGIIDILKEQTLFREILGGEKYRQLSSLKKYLLHLPAVSQALENQNIHIGFVPGKQQEIELVFFTQFQNKPYKQQIINSLKASGTQLETVKNLTKLTLADSSVFFLGIEENLVVISSSSPQVEIALEKVSPDKADKFLAYIQLGNRFNKNTLARLNINFNRLPDLLNKIIAEKLHGALSGLSNLNSYASLTYNYSNNKVLLTGTTTVIDPDHYYNLFSSLEAKKISIHTILPQNTASYNIFAIDSYLPWRQKLDQWFASKQEDQKIKQLISNISTKYHLNLDDAFPKYFKDQLLTFQLSSTEKIGAINLTNGDKLTQLLIDLSSDYNDEIKILKESDLLYAYFGYPFEGFKRPYYVILDNYMVFANHASSLQVFLNSYNNNKLLINNPNYINASNQLPGNANLSFYIDHSNSAEIFKKNIYPSFLEHLQSEEGLMHYDSFTYQLSGDNGKFQTNILINKQAELLQKDSLAL